MKASVPISFKMIFVSMLCVGLGLGGLSLTALNFLKNEVHSRALNSNKDLAEVLSLEISNEFKKDLEKMTIMAKVYKESTSSDLKTKISSILNSQDEIVSFGVYGSTTKNQYSELFFAANQDGLAEFGISQSDLSLKPLSKVIKAAAPHPDGVTVVNTSPLLKKSVLTLVFFKENLLFRSEIRGSSFLRYFIHKDGLGIYIVDTSGSIFLSNGESPGESGSLRFSKNIGYGLDVVTDLDESTERLPVEQMQYRALLICVIAMGITFILAYLFSIQFTSPLASLYKGFEKIATGHFDFNPDVRNNDEIGTLGSAFKKMASRLQERERLKNTLSKFSKPEDVEKILNGEMKLPLEKKTMTVLICELQGGIEGSLGPEDTLKQITAFWTEVSRAINKYLGFIDKSNGTSMKAVWGALTQVNDEGSSALASALEIRKATKLINEKRAVAGFPPLKIGIGIHTGEVVAGQVLIEGRGEYTFMGVGPIFTTQVTAATREIDADILVSEETYILIKNKGYTFGPVTILNNLKGLRVHQVIGRKQAGVIESELSKSQQETILTGSLQMHAQTQIQAYPEILNRAPPAQSGSFTQSGYRFDISGSNSNSANSFQSYQTQAQPVPIQLQPAPNRFIAPAEEPQWYLMRNPQSGISEGPFTVTDLRSISDQPGFIATQSYAYRYGDTMMVPLLQVPGVSRRERQTQLPPAGMPLPPEQIQASARSEDWYVQREDGQIYGPYSFIQLSDYLESGHIARSTYCWRQGMPNWLYAYQVPGLDRRQGGPPQAPIPLPKAG